jgi:hypothetical protein
MTTLDQPTITADQAITAAVEQLASSQRGKQALGDLRALIANQNGA